MVLLVTAVSPSLLTLLSSVHLTPRIHHEETVQQVIRIGEERNITGFLISSFEMLLHLKIRT